LTPNEPHYQDVADAILEGDVVPFLGAGVNLCQRNPVPTPFAPGPYLPSGTELAEYLATKRRFPPEETTRDLLRVAQYVGVRRGWGKLYQDLRGVFTTEYTPNSAHKLLARLPRELRNANVPQQLVITTNYDDALERAYDEVGEKYDVVYYDARRDGHLGKFFHRRHGAEVPDLIEVPNEYAELDLAERPVILKIHGAIDRVEATRDSYVITEDDYIEYLTRDEIRGFSALKAPMQQRSFLFLGYSLQDWNLRVILNRIWDKHGPTMHSWAIQKHDEARSEQSIEVERKLWDDRGDVELLFEDLAVYVEKLGTCIFGSAAAAQPSEASKAEA
jgi:SIR2-like domain